MAGTGSRKRANPDLADDVNALVFDYITHDAIQAVLTECAAHLDANTTSEEAHDARVAALEDQTQLQLDLVDSFLRLVDDDSSVQRVPIFRLRLLHMATLFSAYLSENWERRLSASSLDAARARNRRRAEKWWAHRRQGHAAAYNADMKALRQDTLTQHPTPIDSPFATRHASHGPRLSDLIGPFVALTSARAQLGEPRSAEDIHSSSQSSSADGSSPWSINAQWLHLAGDLMLMAALTAHPSEFQGPDDGSGKQPVNAMHTIFSWGPVPETPGDHDDDDEEDATDLYDIFILDSDSPERFYLWYAVREEAMARLDSRYRPRRYPTAKPEEDDQIRRQTPEWDKDDTFEDLLSNLLDFLRNLHDSLPQPILTQIEGYRDRKAKRAEDDDMDITMDLDDDEKRTIELDVGMWLTEQECDTLASIVSHWQR